MAKVAGEVGWTVDAKERQEAEAILAELDAPNQLSLPQETRDGEIASLSLADRFETVLQSGRKIATG
jgi:hypothetical protein